MTLSLANAPLSIPVVCGAARDDAKIVSRVQTILARTGQGHRGLERRYDQRYPYPYLIYLTPVSQDGKAVMEETVVAVGKHLSDHGLDFYHREPLPYRRMIVSFETCDGSWLGILMDLTWCRFNRHGWYDNGGRFLGTVESPLTAKARGRSALPGTTKDGKRSA